MPHWSSCAIYNEPALEAGSCSCGGFDPAVEADHDGVIAIVSLTRGKRTLFCQVGTENLVKAEKLPANSLIALASAAHLPYAHDVVAFFGDADSVHFNDAGIAVIPEV